MAGVGGVRDTLSRTVVLVGFAALVGIVAALLWANVSVLPHWTVYEDLRAQITDTDRTQVFSATFWYSILGVIGGVLVGLAAWIRLRHVGWPVAVIAAGLALVGGVTCWMLGEVFGPGPFPERLAAATEGDQVPIALRLQAPSALAIWVFAAVSVPLFAASLGPEISPPKAPERRRPVELGPDDE